MSKHKPTAATSEGEPVPMFEAYVLIRVKSGWNIKTLLLPQHVVDGYVASEKGSYDSLMLSAKMNEIIEMRCFQKGK